MRQATTRVRRWCACATLIALASFIRLPARSVGLLAGAESGAREVVDARALPGGLQLPVGEFSGSFTSVVTADIDADGDLDVVASDGALHLFVWTNDGSGRLVRQEPRETGGWQAEALPPGLDGWPTSGLVSVQNNVPSIHADRDRRDVSLEPLAFDVRLQPLADSVSFAYPSSPRAPPSTFSFS